MGVEKRALYYCFLCGVLTSIVVVNAQPVVRQSTVDTIYTSSDSIDIIFGSVLQKKRWSCQVIHCQVGLAREVIMARIYYGRLVFGYTMHDMIGLVKKQEHDAIYFVIRKCMCVFGVNSICRTSKVIIFTAFYITHFNFVIGRFSL